LVVRSTDQIVSRYSLMNIHDKVKSSGIDKLFKKKNVLVTGGAGYLGTNLVNALKNVECTICRLDNVDSIFEPFHGLACIRDLKGDVRYPSLWEEAIRDADIVYHFAAQTSTYVANENPPVDLENNVMPILKLLDVCRQLGKKKVVLFSSTATVVGLTSQLPVGEDIPDNPITIYDMHKLMAEQYLKYFSRLEFVLGTILRLSNVYGPGPKSSRPDRGILNQMTKRAIEGKPLTVYGEGDYLRDYVHVEDVIMAFLTAATKIDTLNGHHYMIGSGHGCTIRESMELIADRVYLKTGRKTAIEYVDPPIPQSPIEYRNYVADTRNFSGLTGWKASYDLIQGIDQMIERLL
jgi:nucleoside-diphosphate-sugar epimerase